jgi:hypothetical protein
MSHFCLGRGGNRGARTFGYRWLIQLMLVGAMVYADAANAQATNRSGIRLGIGTFLSRDRGWNFEAPIEVFAAVTRNTGSIDVEAGASVFKSFVPKVYPAVFPPPARPFEDGVAARLHLRAPSLSRSALSAVAGAEVYHNLTDGEVRATTAAGTAGVGIAFGGARRGTLDLRYVRFAKPLGSSRGILPLTFAWRL